MVDLWSRGGYLFVEKGLKRTAEKSFEIFASKSDLTERSQRHPKAGPGSSGKDALAITSLAFIL